MTDNETNENKIKNGIYVNGALLVHTITLDLYIYRMCDASVSGDCNLSNTFLGCGTHSKYITSTGECINCHDSCNGCYGGTSSHCYLCATDYHMDSDVCVPDTATITCHETCKTCDGESQNNCLTCNPPRVLSNDKYCCDVNGDYELSTPDQNCVLKPPVDPSVCTLDNCSLCKSDIGGGECLDLIIPKVEDYVLTKNSCFELEDYFNNKEFCDGQEMAKFETKLVEQTFEKLVF